MRTLFQPEVLKHCEQFKGWSVEGKAEWLVVYRSGQCSKPKAVQQFMTETVQVLHRLSGR